MFSGCTFFIRTSKFKEVFERSYKKISQKIFSSFQYLTRLEITAKNNEKNLENLEMLKKKIGRHPVNNI